MEDLEKIKNIAENIGYIVGKYGNKEEIELFEIFLEDCKKRVEIIEKAIKYIENNDTIFMDKNTNLLANEVKLLKILKGE